MHLLLFCTVTNKYTIISPIITLLHVSTLSCHPQGACNQYLAKLHKYLKCGIVNCITNSCIWNTCVTWQGNDCKLPEWWHDSVETCRSVIICVMIVYLLVIVQYKKKYGIRVFFEKSVALILLLLHLPLALQPTVGFSLSNDVLPLFPICHQLSPSSHSQHLKISFCFFFPSFPGSSPSSRPFQLSL